MNVRNVAVFALALVGCAENANGQEIAQQVRAKGNGTVTLVFASKPGVCGDGKSFISTGRDDDGRRSTFTQTSRGFNTSVGSSDYRNYQCNEGPVVVDLIVDNGVVTEVETNVGSMPLPAHNISARAAVDYLLTLAETPSRATAGKHAILPALLADSVDVSPRLLQIGRNERAPQEVRKSAIFWLGQDADAADVAGLKALVRDDDDEIGKAAIFALSQVRTDESTRILIEVARDSNSPQEVRKQAIFWLGQAAGDKATEGLKDLMNDDDTEVKKQAVFALSQMRSDKSVDALIDVAKNSKDREVRKSALFWLGQSKDPRVLALFEEILLKN